MAGVPTSIGKYQITAQLAQGGMGAVYTAVHPTLERTVIIKKLTLRGNANIRERFRREAQIMMDLRNDTIVDVYDHFREGSSYYIVLEYVDGLSLEDLIERDRYLPERIALAVLREACRGLAYAHEHRVVHRDIKPANILISRGGEVKLVDFGIATIHGDDASTLTQEGTTLGTPSYMAPEQFQSSRSVDYRADIYSLGVVLYEMVTGKRPYAGSMAPEVIARIQRGAFPRPRSVNPRVGRAVSRLIRRLMHKKPHRRPTDLDRFVRRLDRRLGIRGRTGAAAILAPYVSGDQLRVGRPRRRAPRIAAATILVAALLVSAGWSVYHGYHRELLFPSRTAAVEIAIRVSADDRAPEDLSVSAQITPTASNPAPETSRTLPIRGYSRDGAESWMFRSRRIQVVPGSYRITAEVGSQLLVSTVRTESLAERARSPFVIPGRSAEATQVLLEVPEPEPRPLTVTHAARDAATGALLGGSRVEVWTGERWVGWSRRASSAQSGQTYRLRISRFGYAPEEFALRVAAHQSSVHVEARLRREER